MVIRMSGIENRGNTCFAAAVIQVLRYCKPVVRRHLVSDDPVLHEFYDALYAGHSAEPFLKRLPALGYAAHEQHDAHEFFMTMVEKMFPTDNPFEGEITSILECVDAHMSVSKYPCCSLLVHGDVQAGLTAFCTPEKVDAKCETCGLPVTKRMSVTTGDVMLVQLQRFSHDGQKLTHQVHIPPCITNVKPMHLCGVIHHMGSVDFGHYTATVRTDDGWKAVSDDFVVDVEAPETSRSAYILVYTCGE